MNSTLTLSITTYNEDGTVANVETSNATVVNSAADLEAFFAAALNNTTTEENS